MRIAQVAPLEVAVPPRRYGGTERVIYNLTEALVQRGHEVTLYASGDSITSARLVPFNERAFGFEAAINVTPHHLAELTEVYRHAGDYDVIHSHLDHLTLPFGAHSATPTVITLHGALDIPDEQRILRTYPDANYISISNSQRRPLPELRWMATVYHGVDVASFPYSAQPGGYLAFVGRISPEKDPVSAIEIARRASVPLKIAAKIDPAERTYFKERVKPLLDDPLIEFLGPLNERRKRELLRGALALLLPIDWPEPFGMVYVEALACGTPVLTRPKGSAPELLRDEVTGFMRDSNEELAAAVRELPSLPRATCRRYCAERFDRQRMAGDYERIYRMLRDRASLADLALDDVRSDEISLLEISD